MRMISKEMMVYAATKPAALALLEEEMMTHLRLRTATSWRWIKKPAALRGKATKEWRAYGRVEYSK